MAARARRARQVLPGVLTLSEVCLEPAAPAFSHDFADARICVVLGRNAAGKTRLARVVAGLDAPSSGRLLLDGVDITAQPSGQRSVALVYQAFVNYPQWTVAENLASPLLAQRLSAADIRARVAALAARLGLEAVLERLPAELSGGQQQRVAIGRALAKGASVLVMDEPLVNLDYKLREALTAELRTLLHESGITVIYTTSDPRDAFALGDEVLLLEAHAPVQAGAPLTVYDHPASPSAVDLMSDPGANRLRIAGGEALVRPEHLYLERGAPADVSFTARVLSWETNGSETYLHCLVEGQHWVAKLDGLVDLRPEDTVTLFADAACVFEFVGAERG